MHPSYTGRMQPVLTPTLLCVPLAVAAAALTLVVGCGGDRPADNGETPSSGPSATAAPQAAPAGADAPDTGDMGPFVLAKINANPNIAGTATLVEFRQKS